MEFIFWDLYFWEINECLILSWARRSCQSTFLSAYMFQISRGNECPRKIETNALFDRVGKPIHRHRPLKGFFVQVYAKTGCVWHGNQPCLDSITSGIQTGRGRFTLLDVGEVTQRASQMTGSVIAIVAAVMVRRRTYAPAI